mgnify:CR=1 FL=1
MKISKKQYDSLPEELKQYFTMEVFKDGQANTHPTLC